jgi:hypothetical protein
LPDSQVPLRPRDSPCGCAEEGMMPAEQRKPGSDQVQVCPHPIFIVGSPRSGTTILALSLAQHSQLWTSGETYVLFDLFPNQQHLEQVFHRARALSRGGFFNQENISQEEFRAALGIGLNALFTSRSQGKRWIDHTPHHVFILDLLTTLFPGAFFLHILRDPCRVIHSMIHFQDRLVDGKKAESVIGVHVPRWAVDFREACRTWCSSVRRGLEYCSSNPQRGLTVVNESLSADPGAGFRRVFEFIAVPEEPAPAHYFRTHRPNSSFPRSTVPASPGPLPSHGPWTEWTREQKRIFLDEVVPTALQYRLFTEAEVNLLRDEGS